jgi:hypothetical protein
VNDHRVELAPPPAADVEVAEPALDPGDDPPEGLGLAARGVLGEAGLGLAEPAAGVVEFLTQDAKRCRPGSDDVPQVLDLLAEGIHLPIGLFDRHLAGEPGELFDQAGQFGFLGGNRRRGAFG